jgi:hypothetical protein
MSRTPIFFRHRFLHRFRSGAASRGLGSKRRTALLREFAPLAVVSAALCAPHQSTLSSDEVSAVSRQSATQRKAGNLLKERIGPTALLW